MTPPGAPPRTGSLIVLVVTACAIVAIGSGGVGLIQPPARPDDAWLLRVRVAGAGAALIGLLALLSLRRSRTRPSGPDATVESLAAAARIMGVVALLALLSPAPRAEDPAAGSGSAGSATYDADAPVPETPPRLPDTPPPPSNQPPQVGDVQEPERVPPPPPALDDAPARQAPDFDLDALRRAVNVLLLVLVVLLAVVGAWLLSGWRSGRRAERSLADEADRDEAEAGLEASLDAVSYDEGDPRWQITRAYHALLDALFEAGAPREPFEAPHEHLSRALGPLGVGPEPLHRLAELYVLAQFGDGPVTDHHRTAAADALRASLAGLRAAAAVPDGLAGAAT